MASGSGRSWPRLAAAGTLPGQRKNQGFGPAGRPNHTTERIEGTMAAADLEAIARKMVEGGRGILAADESNSTANKRLGKLKIDPTVENRQAYREMLFTTPR